MRLAVGVILGFIDGRRVNPEPPVNQVKDTYLRHLTLTLTHSHSLLRQVSLEPHGPVPCPFSLPIYGEGL